MFWRHLDSPLNNVLELVVCLEVVRHLDMVIFVGPFQLNSSISNETFISGRAEASQIYLVCYELNGKKWIGKK